MALSEKARQARNAYSKKWKERNPEKVKQISKRWQQSAHGKEYLKKWRAANRDKIQEYNERYWHNQAIEMDETVNNIVSVPNKTVKTGEPGQAVCINCGGFFQPKRTTAKYCRDLCRKQYNRRK